jgi:probable selenium-dependent hydroxylase accessory protein YqeC
MARALLESWGILEPLSVVGAGRETPETTSADTPQDKRTKAKPEDETHPGACPIICVVGAGGKSTTTFALAKTLAAAGRRTILTTTTKMGHDQTGGLRTTAPDHEIIAAMLSVDKHTAVRVAIQNDPSSPKVVGPSPAWIDAISTSGAVDAIVIEADGARRKNVKAPGPMEPVFPSLCTHIVAVLGGDSLNRVIEDQGHRPMRIAAAAGCAPYDRLTATRATQLLISDIGGRKGHTANRRWAAFVTQIREENRPAGEDVVAMVRAAGYVAYAVEVDPTAASLVRPPK